MSIAINPNPRITDVTVDEDAITAQLADGRVVSVPLAWSWRLSDATPAQRSHFEIVGDGYGVHWPDIDEDLSGEGLLTGTPARRPIPNAAGPRYAVVIERPPGGNYRSYVPDLPGCCATGGTLDEVKHNISTAIHRHLEALQIAGMPVPESKTLVTYEDFTPAVGGLPEVG